MRKHLLAIWCLIPVGLGAYHLGPGQDRLLIDDAAAAMERAEEAMFRASDLESSQPGELATGAAWAAAAEEYELALKLLPAERVDTQRRVRLELAKCRMFLSRLPEANAQLQVLVDEMAEDENAEAEVLRDARHALANSQYYLTWLMRLEGAGREEWEPTIEAARQTFKLLAESAPADGPRDEAHRNLEASIRLARMDLTELQGLPLPSQ